MGRKNRNKRRWYDDFSDADRDLFGNSIKQHNQHLKDKDIYTYDEDEYLESPYQFDYGWDRKLVDRTMGKGKDDKGYTSYDYAREDFHRASYGGGVWRGYEYYRVQQLSYKYVQQMANTLAAQHRISVEVGTTWKVDLKKRVLTYNPASLVYGTKSELLATLMHEIGKLRYSTHPDEVKEKYLAVYGTPAVEVLSIFEDIRVDFWMLKAYEGAADIYEAAIPAVDKKIKEYRERSQVFKKAVIAQLGAMFDRLVEHAQRFTGGDHAKFEAVMKDNMQKIFGVSDPVEVKQKIDEVAKEIIDTGSIFDYCGEMLRVMYDADSDETKFDNIKEKVTLTETSIQPVKKLDATQKVATHLSSDVYPQVEDLLRDFNRDNEKIRNMFPNMPQVVIEHLAQDVENLFNQMTNGNGSHVNTDKDGNSSVRTSAPTNNIVPKEWMEGNYNPIRDSVMPEIRSLVQKLTFLRREELAQKHQADQRRGKLHSKKLYKSALGNRRVFKKLLPNSNTVQSFAFSLVIDTSGSMGGSRIVHTVRALTIFSEVFKKMDIPFEIVDFSSDARTIKKFDEQVDKNIEKRIAGLVNHADGGTNLDRGLKKMQLEKQEQKNKVCIVLTDGGVGDIKMYDRDYFIPMQKRGVLSVGFGLECEREMAQLCMGNSKVLENASTLPIEFANLLRSLIKKK